MIFRHHSKAKGRLKKNVFRAIGSRGFTIAELLIATVILGILITTSAGIYTNFYNSFRNLKAANLVYDESRLVMERIVKEVRGGTIDFEEYYNQSANFFGAGVNETYGQNYCQYSRQFYAAGPDGQYGTFDDESVGARNLDVPAPLENPVQKKLYLIDSNGTRRTYIKRVEDQDVGKIALLKLVGRDCGIDRMCSDEPGNTCPKDQGERDGLIDTWMCDTGFSCFGKPIEKTLPPPELSCSGQIEVVRDDPSDIKNSSFLDITPSTLDVVDLQFFIVPKDDPFKAYADPSNQIQPQVTIRLTARASKRIASEFRGGTPEIVLESTVSARAHSAIVTECNLQECINADTRACSRVGDVAGGAQETCVQGGWAGCTDEVYQAQAVVNMIAAGESADGLDHSSVFLAEGGRTFFENLNELGSCGDFADSNDALLCKQRRCTDGRDNDGNGLTDDADPACLFQLCNNGILDPGEECIDVGGVCLFRQKTLIETGDSCFDGYDNDCNFISDDPATPVNESAGTGADEFDQNCINYICSNGEADPRQNNPFLKPDYSPKNYLLGAELTDYTNDLDEQCVDIGGLCDNASIANEDHHSQPETGPLCFDNLDNDCDYDPLTDNGGADEFDNECAVTICGNNQVDCGLAPSNYSFKNYLMGYNDLLCNPLLETDNDERCTDAGGLCGAIPTSELLSADTSPVIHNEYCFDGKDQDCDGQIDQKDADCCPDPDGDSFSPLIAGLCQPANALEGGPPGTIDCNDFSGIYPADSSLLGVNIWPGQTERCDDAIYPLDFPLFTVNGKEVDLRGKPVDNNCSAANQLFLGDSGWDRDDPACCVDADNDGFGSASAHLYQKAGKCQGSASGLPERPTFDCQDSNPAISPSALENTPTLCRDGLNNNCRISSATGFERFDHIDMWASSSPPYSGAKDIAQAFAEQRFDPECCNLSAMELCDDTESLLGDGSGSDENCNGLQGFDDHYCMAADDTFFFDNFTSNTFINAASTAFLDTDKGLLTVEPVKETNQFALSNAVPLNKSTCSNVVSVKLSPSADIPPGTQITYEVSNDDGATFEPYSAPSHSFSTTGNSLRWQANLVSDGLSLSPILDSMTVSFSCDSGFGKL